MNYNLLVFIYKVNQEINIQKKEETTHFSLEQVILHNIEVCLTQHKDNIDKIKFRYEEGTP